MSDSMHNSELMMIAGQIYVRMRRCNGRIVDALYMAKNEAYAREILELAVKQPDTELLLLASRFEKLLDSAAPVLPLEPVKDATQPKPVREPSQPSIPVLRMVETPVPPAPVLSEEPVHVVTEEEVAHHYIGALR